MTEAALAIEHLPAPEAALALSDDGRRLVRVYRGAVLIDELRVAIEGAVVAAVLDREVWCVARDARGARLERVSLDGTPIGAATPLGPLGGDVRISAARRGLHALVTGQRELELRVHEGGIAVSDLGARGRDARILLPGRGILERRGGSLVLLRAGTVGELALTLPVELPDSVVVGGGLLFDGGMIAVEIAARNHQHCVLAYDARRGALQSRVRISDAAVLAIAERTGAIVIGRERHLALLELRSGRCRCERVLATPACAVAIDATGKRVVVADALGELTELGPMLGDRDRECPPAADATATDAPVVPEDRESGVVPEDRESGDSGDSTAEAHHPRETRDRGDGRVAVEAPDEPAAAPPTELGEASKQVLAALGPVPMRSGVAGAELDAYLADLHAWIRALCHAAHASAGGPESERDSNGSAADAIGQARAANAAALDRLSAWARRRAPHVEVARELRLSPLATSMLLAIAAPQIWGELARAYGAVTADRARPLVDELLLAHLLDAGTQARSAIAAELDEDAPLVASGAVVVGNGVRPYAPLSVHPVIARRLAGAVTAGDPADAPCNLDEIIGPRAALAALVQHLAEPADPPPRIVLRGRAGAGRRTIAAALATQAGRAVRPIAIGIGADADRKLRQAMRDAALRGDLPCVSLDDVPDDPAIRQQISGVLAAHRGALFVRAPLEGDLPLEPGYAVVELPPLDDAQRREVWRRELSKRHLALAVTDELAARFAVGAGTIVQVCAGLERTEPSDPIDVIATKLRQHRSSCIANLANRVTRLPAWSDFVVSDEIADSLRELVARVKYRRTVLEDWGMDQVATTAQGVTALFQGGPGTGKTMAAGVVARALGYELWRVDLSKVVSKWIGETEKNLARVFDAAEESEVVLLFDEADSLFGKRTDVKTSNDRNANLETNYLLQRLDAFTGIAILTTNFGTAVDAAFKRRLTVQLQFPFPDESERERLWRAHLPPRLPLASDLDLGALARRYQLSGGYIRNTALRAAYLAAADHTPLGQGHLERAIKAMYRDQAQVTTSGRME